MHVCVRREITSPGCYDDEPRDTGGNKNLTAPNIMTLARVNCDPEPELTSTWSSAMGLKLQPTGSTNNQFFNAELSLYNTEKIQFLLHKKADVSIARTVCTLLDK